MGQAKFRKEQDPTYGKIAQKSKIRGLIISPPTEIDGTSIRVKTSNLDDSDLRFSLMFWDRLSWPKSRMIGFGESEDVKFLQSSGVLYRPAGPDIPGGGQMSDLMLMEQRIIYEHYEAKEPGVWSISNGENSLQEIKNVEESSDALLSLMQSVPVPKWDVPLAEILEFKSKRRDELLLFRAHMDSLVGKIATAEDSFQELELEIRNMDAACADLVKTTREWQYPVQISDFKVSLNLSLADALSAIAKSYAGGTVFSFSETTKAVTAAAAVAQSQFKITATTKFQTIKKQRSPLRYAYSLNRHFEI